MKIAVVGLGYVGLLLSLQFARSCVSVLEIDVDPKKIDLVNNGHSYVKPVEHSAIAIWSFPESFYRMAVVSRRHA